MPEQNDLVFAPTEDLHPEGFVSNKQDTIDTPWQHVAEPSSNESNTRKPVASPITSPVDLALATYQRSAARCLLTAVSLIGTTAAGNVPQSGPVKLVDSQKGRRLVVIKCPPSNTKGAYISHDVDVLDISEGLASPIQPFAWLVSPGDPPLYLPTEDAIWTIGIAGTTITDVIQAAVIFDPI